MNVPNIFNDDSDGDILIFLNQRLGTLSHRAVRYRTEIYGGLEIKLLTIADKTNDPYKLLSILVAWWEGFIEINDKTTSRAINYNETSGEKNYFLQ